MENFYGSDKPIYRHYKGGFYKLICEAILEWCVGSKDSEVVIYESMSTGKVWVRRKDDFFGFTVNGTKRFELVNKGE